MQIGVNIPLADLQRTSPQKLAAWIMLRQLQNPDAEVREQLESFLLDKSKYANMDGDEFDSKFGRTEELAAAVLQEFFKDFKTSPQNLARKLLEEAQPVQPAPVVSTKGLQPPLSAHNVNLFRSKYVNFFQDLDILSSHLIRVSRRIFEESLRYEGLVLLLHDPKRDVYHMARISDYHEGEGDEIYGNIPGMSSAVHVRGFVHVPHADFVEFRGAREAGTVGIQTELDFLPGIVVGQKLPISGLVVNKIIVADEAVLFAGIHTGEVPYQVIERCAQCHASLADGKFECTGCDSIAYCGEHCAEAHWNEEHAFICGKAPQKRRCINAKEHAQMRSRAPLIGYSLKPDEGVRAITYGTVDFNPNYAFIRLGSLEAEELVALARKYVEIKGLVGWNIRAPYAWMEYENSGPHVTIEMSKELVKGEGVQVVLQKLDHFTTQTSRWVILHVRLPPKFKCPYGCHLSIGQERLKQ